MRLNNHYIANVACRLIFARTASGRQGDWIAARLLLAAILCLSVFVGCRRSDPKTTGEETATSGKDRAANHESTEQARRATEKQPASAPATRTAGRVAPCVNPHDVPARESTCGHAVAFVGWRSGLEENSEKVLFFDPGDNALEIGRHEHRWKADPAETPVFFGKRRPSIVLEPAGVFTVCGAVVMSPRGDAEANAPVDGLAKVMPDLSQALDEKWPGLCGPTSAANLIYAIGTRRHTLVSGLPLGPSAHADERAARLIVGLNGDLDENSLAFRMGLREGGLGVTNEGMRNGLAEWLSHRDPGAWKVDLEWLADDEKAPEQQARFFQRCEFVSRSGGGVILCLWPGSEFADGSAAEATSRQTAASSTATNSRQGGNADNRGDASPSQSPPRAASSNGDRADSAAARGVTQHEAEASSPKTSTPAPAESGGGQTNAGRGFRGKKPNPNTVAAALQSGVQAIEKAKKARDAGNMASALEGIGEAIAVLRPYAGASAECRTALATATEIAASLNAALPRKAPAIRTPTTFE